MFSTASGPTADPIRFRCTSNTTATSLTSTTWAAATPVIVPVTSTDPLCGVQATSEGTAASLDPLTVAGMLGDWEQPPRATATTSTSQAADHGRRRERDSERPGQGIGYHSVVRLLLLRLRRPMPERKT